MSYQKKYFVRLKDTNMHHIYDKIKKKQYKIIVVCVKMFFSHFVISLVGHAHEKPLQGTSYIISQKYFIKFQSCQGGKRLPVGSFWPNTSKKQLF